MYKITFDTDAFEDYSNWAFFDKKIFKRIFELIIETKRGPFKGLGKPEPLKGNLSGCWSRRIDDKHRLVYKVIDQELKIISCKGHYEK